MTKKMLQKMVGVSGLANDPVESIRSIEEVIAALEKIIITSNTNSIPLGYFAILYQKVTMKVKEGIAHNLLDTQRGMGNRPNWRTRLGGG